MATVTVRIDDSVKTKLYQVADDLGIPVSSIFNAFAKELIRKKKISFSLLEDSIEDQEMYDNAINIKKRGRKSLKSGRSSLVI